MLATACRRLALARAPAPCPSHRVLAAPSTATSARAVVVMAGGRKRAHVKIEVDDAGDDEDAKATTPKAAAAKTKKKTPPFSPPEDWRDVLAAIKRQRAVGGAPVDTMGCEKISEDAAPDDRGRRFVTLVSAMLSSQTKDPITHAATARLVKHGCTPENIAATSAEDLAAIIRPVGFHARKGQYLRDAARACVERHGGDIPSDVDGLMALPGVGPKMAYLVMNVGWGVPSGICVDVHVHRIAERLGWVPSVAFTSNGTPRKNRTPEDTREALEAWLPREEWIEINPLLVGHGQLTCAPKAPKCGECAANAMCPSAFKDEEARRAKKEEKNAAAEAQG